MADKKIKIYFIVDKENNLVKIGKSNNPSIRLSNISSSNPFPLELFTEIETEDHSLEEELHYKFREYNVKGEWFEFRKDEMCEYLFELTNDPKFKKIKEENIENNNKIISNATSKIISNLKRIEEINQRLNEIDKEEKIQWLEEILSEIKK